MLCISGVPRLCSPARSEEHTSELQSLRHLVCRLLLEKKKDEVEIAEQGDPDQTADSQISGQTDKLPRAEGRDRDVTRMRQSFRAEFYQRKTKTVVRKK